MISSAFHNLSNLFYPSRCIYCGGLNGGDNHCCENCKAELKPIESPCRHCGAEEKDCNCHKNVREYSMISAPYYFSTLTKHAIHSIKFYGDTQAKSEMAKEMCKVISRDFGKVNFDFVMGVPMTRKRRNERGYNQADLLAKEIASMLSLQYKEKVIDKIFDNIPQHETDGKLRAGNVIGVYDIGKNAEVAGKTILLIDDVKTTSATLNECAKVLKIYGATQVFCSTFALTKPPKKRKNTNEKKLILF